MLVKKSKRQTFMDEGSTIMHVSELPWGIYLEIIACVQK
jgi:hypothetical protein